MAPVQLMSSLSASSETLSHITAFNLFSEWGSVNFGDGKGPSLLFGDGRKTWASFIMKMERRGGGRARWTEKKHVPFEDIMSKCT